MIPCFNISTARLLVHRSPPRSSSQPGDTRDGPYEPGGELRGTVLRASSVMGSCRTCDARGIPGILSAPESRSCRDSLFGAGGASTKENPVDRLHLKMTSNPAYLAIYNRPARFLAGPGTVLCTFPLFCGSPLPARCASKRRRAGTDASIFPPSFCPTAWRRGRPCMITADGTPNGAQ